MLHGPRVIWQNIPGSVLYEHFSRFNVIEAIFNIGILPFLLGIYVVYRYMVREKNWHIYLLIGFASSVFVLLWLRLIEISAGLMFFGVLLVILFSQFYKLFLSFIEKSMVARFRPMFLILFFILFLSTSVYPSIILSSEAYLDTPAEEEINALLWLKENSEQTGTVAAALKEGALINAVAERKNVADRNFLFAKNPEQRLEDLYTLYTTPYLTDAQNIIDKYNIDYIILSEISKDEFNTGELEFVDDRCFELVYDSEIKIYRTLCRIT